MIHSPPSISLTAMLDTLDIKPCMLHVVCLAMMWITNSFPSVGEVAVRCVGKMRVLCAVVEMEVGEREREGEAASQTVATHSKWLGGQLSESNYREGDNSLSCVALFEHLTLQPGYCTAMATITQPSRPSPPSLPLPPPSPPSTTCSVEPAMLNRLPS